MTGLVLLLGISGGCSAPVCRGDIGEPMRIYTLFFGLAVAGAPDVSDQQWAAFRDRVITPHVPDGYTVLDAQGAWRATDSQRTVTERSKMLIVALPDRQQSADAISQIRAAYQTMFHQQSVGLIVQPGCAAF